MNDNKALEALNELGATPVPFICNQDGDTDIHHLRDDKPEEYEAIRSALVELAEIKKRAEEKMDRLRRDTEDWDFPHKEFTPAMQAIRFINYILKGEPK